MVVAVVLMVVWGSRWWCVGEGGGAWMMVGGVVMWLWCVGVVGGGVAMEDERWRGCEASRLVSLKGASLLALSGWGSGRSGNGEAFGTWSENSSEKWRLRWWPECWPEKMTGGGARKREEER
ncbi:hypothetical protein Tco_1009929 [Tanacetum coccineum]